MANVLQKLRAVFWPDGKIARVKIPMRDRVDVTPAQSLAEKYHDQMGVNVLKRRDAYDVYEAMDELSEIAAVLDNYAEDATSEDHEHKKIAWIEAKNQTVKKEGEFLLSEILRYEDWAAPNARDIAKYGDDFAMIAAKKGEGIQSILWRDPRDLERVENKHGLLLGFEESAKLSEYKRKVSQSIQNGGDGSEVKPSYEPWEIIHFRLWKKKRLPGEKIPNIYGTSILSGSERVAKQNKILDDLLMVMRLTRSLDRRRYMIDTGRSPVEEEVRILKRWKRALKRRTYADPASGRFDTRFDPFGWTEDEFWPVKEGSNSTIEVTEGITDIKEIADIDHFKDKLAASLRAPKADDDVEKKMSLSSQNVRWARAVMSLQKAIKQGLKRLCMIHFAWKNMSVKETDFEIMMTTPSLIELLERLEAWQQIVDVAERMSTLGDTLNLNKKDWTVYILNNVLWLSDQESKKFARGIPDEAVGDLDTGFAEPEPPRPQPKPEPQPEPKEEPPKGKDDEKKTEGLTEEVVFDVGDIDEAIDQVTSQLLD